MIQENNHGIEPDGAIDDEASGPQPALDDLLAQYDTLAAGDWNGLEPPTAQERASLQKEQQTAIREENRILHDTFASDDGRKALEIMCGWSVQRDIYPRDTFGMTIDQLAPIGIRRDAENKFMKRILNAVSEHRSNTQNQKGYDE